MVKRGRCDDEIGLRESVASFAAVLDQQSPPEHDVLGDSEDTLLEHWPHLMREPIIKLSAAIGIRDEFNTEPDFGEGHSTQIEKVKWLTCNEGYDFAFWLGAAQFGEYVGVE
jgi:hypothetical protein